MRIALFILLAAGAARAEGNAGLVVVDRGDRVDVIVRGMVAATGPATSFGDRVEIPLADLPISPLSLRSGDPTVSKVELIAGPKPRLSIALHHGRDTTAKIAGAAEIVAAPEGFRVTLVRSEALKNIMKRPETAIAAAPAVEIKPIEAIAPPIAAPAPAPAPAQASAPAPTATATAITTATPIVTQTPPIAPPLGTQTASEMSPVRLGALVIGLLACVVLVFVARKRRGATTGEHIRVIASQSLGGKHRMVLVSAGKREFLLALSEKEARVLGRWRKAQTAHAVAERPIEMPARPMISAMETPAPPIALPPASPAVAGLLRLRRTSPSAEGTPQNDLEWAARLARARSAENDA